LLCQQHAYGVVVTKSDLKTAGSKNCRRVQVVFKGPLGEQYASASCPPIEFSDSSLASCRVRLLLTIVEMELRQTERCKPLCPHPRVATTGGHHHYLPRIDQGAQVRDIRPIRSQPRSEPGQELNVVGTLDNQKQTYTTVWFD
jgi:hypothetical protein